MIVDSKATTGSPASTACRTSSLMRTIGSTRPPRAHRTVASTPIGPHCASMSVETNDQIRVTRDGAIATIWLNRPEKRNAMNYAMWAMLQSAAEKLASAPDVRVVVVRGSGPHFCAGADITELS